MSYYKNKSSIIATRILVAAVVGLCIVAYPVSSVDAPKTNVNETADAKVVAVEEVLGTPENFTGSMGVSGRVMNVDQAKSMFFLGCKSTGSCVCAKMPVKYEGKMPEIGSDIIVFGEITTTDAGKFIFEGKEVTPQ